MVEYMSVISNAAHELAEERWAKEFDSLRSESGASDAEQGEGANSNQTHKPRAGPGQTNRPDAPIPCAVSKNLANRDATSLPWVDTRKPEKRVLEVEGHARDLHMYQHTSLASDSV